MGNVISATKTKILFVCDMKRYAEHTVGEKLWAGGKKGRWRVTAAVHGN